MFNKKILVFILIIAIVVALGLFFNKSFAVTPPFGGFVTTSFYCSCSGNFLLTIGPPLGGQFIYNNTPQFLNEQLPRLGVWALGLYAPMSIGCWVPAGHGCIQIGLPLGTITPIVGTSL